MEFVCRVYTRDVLERRPTRKKKISPCREEEEKQEARAPNVLNRERSRNTPLVQTKEKSLAV